MTDTFGTSQPVRRREDVRLLTGRGRYIDDLDEGAHLHAAFLRATVAHGRIASIDASAALDAPGVVAVFTGDDLKQAGLGGIHARPPLPGTEMDPPIMTPRPGLAYGVVRHVGEPVAVVIARTRKQAEDAAELVFADIEELPAAVEIADATADGAPAVWPDLAPDNIALRWHKGDREACDAAFARAAHVTRLRLRNNRLAGNPMEPRSSLAEYDAEADRYTLTCASQGVHYMQEVLCEHVFDLPREKIRIRTFDVGGGFGIKEQPYPEDVAILYAARELGRPVKWQGTRSEHFLCDNHARDAEVEAELALAEDGEFLAIRVSADDAMGAYIACHGPFPSIRNMPNGLPLVYRTPVIDISVRLVMTNTASIGPYRGAGREQASVVMERLVDTAAREMGIDPIELRRRNFIQPEQMPYTSPSGRTYDVGEFEAVLDKALALADHDGYAARRADSEGRGKLRGLGIACTIEGVGAMPYEGAIVRFAEDGRIELTVASQSQGQGHETAFAKLISERLGMRFDDVELRQGDSDDV
ncbi:MAG: xanthine dehydrogenase family protein molybdopterin-binding subunit, partial [Alphaproteobacteria bacterium]|nr:xanthine dehydrogenase family protein molybdopterin-binding subunit [Alphaproteobacteria bacterium]